MSESDCVDLSHWCQSRSIYAGGFLDWVCRQSPHEKSKDFLQYPCTDSYEEPIFITPPNKFEGATRRRRWRAWRGLPGGKLWVVMLSTGFVRLKLTAPAAMHIRPLRGREDGFAIAALRFASCPARVGMTEKMVG